MQTIRRVSACGMDRDSLNLLESATRLYLASKGWIFQETPCDADVVFVDADSREGRSFINADTGVARIVRVTSDNPGPSIDTISKPLRYRNILKVLTELFRDQPIPQEDHGQTLLEVIEQRLVRGRTFLLSIDNSPLQVDPSAGFFFSSPQWKPTPAYFQARGARIFVSEETVAGETGHQRRWKLESLRFNAALHAPQQATQDFHDRAMTLSRWPDLGELNATPTLVRLAALLNSLPATRDELVERSGMDVRDVNAFLFACRHVGLLAFVEPQHLPALASRSDETGAAIFAAIRTRLFG